MGKIFYLLGPSASGKDKVYGNLLEDPALQLKPLVLYTTRPIRKNEENGKQYYFVTEEEYRSMHANGQVIEERVYETVKGPWIYFTVDRGIDLTAGNYLGIGTLESYVKLKEYYGADVMEPLFLEVSGEERLLRSIHREMKQETPNLQEVCRRFLADSDDFSEEKIRAAGITTRFDNNGDLDACIAKVAKHISEMI